MRPVTPQRWCSAQYSVQAAAWKFGFSLLAAAGLLQCLALQAASGCLASLLPVNYIVCSSRQKGS